MTFLPLLALVLTTAFPSTSKVSWMRPEAFRLAIGMSRAEALLSLRENGLATKEGKDPTQLLVDYTDDRGLTLQFHKDRLWSIRFELYALIPEAHVAFAEEKAFLLRTFGEPKKKVPSKSIVLYDHLLPNVMVVLGADPKSEGGRKGLGYLVVRYFDPAPPR